MIFMIFSVYWGLIHQLTRNIEHLVVVTWWTTYEKCVSKLQKIRTKSENHETCRGVVLLDTVSIYNKYHEYHFLNHQIIWFFFAGNQIIWFDVPVIQIWSVPKNSRKKLTKYNKKIQKLAKFGQGVLNNVWRYHKKLGQKNKKTKNFPKITKLVGELCYHMYRLCARLEKISSKSATFDAYNSHISRCVITWITCGDCRCFRPANLPRGYLR
jgi:hypothetical protein